MHRKIVPFEVIWILDTKLYLVFAIFSCEIIECQEFLSEYNTFECKQAMMYHGIELLYKH